MEHASPSPPHSSRADLIGSESPVTAEAAERFIEAATQVALAQWCRACCSYAFRRWSTRFLWLDRLAVRADALFFWREATRAFAAILHAADAHRRSTRLQQKQALRRAQRWVRWKHGVRAGCARLEQASRRAAVFGVRWLTRRTLRVWQRRRQLRRVAVSLSQVKLRHLQGGVACRLRRWVVHCRREALRRDAHRSELRWLLLRWRSRAASKASRESASVQTQRATRQVRLEDATREWRLLCARMAALCATLATAKSAAAAAAFRQMRSSLRKIAQRRVCEELCFHERRHRHLRRTLAALSDWGRLLAEKRAAAAARRASADGLWLRHAAARWRRRIADLRARLRALCTQEAALAAALSMLRTRRMWSRWRRWRNVGRDQLRRRWRQWAFRRLRVACAAKACSSLSSFIAASRGRSCQMSRALVALDFAAAARRAEQPLETLSSLLAMRHDLLALAIATHRLRAHSQWRLFCIPHRSACLRRWLKRWMEVVAAMLSSYVRRHVALVQVHRSRVQRGWDTWCCALAVALMRGIAFKTRVERLSWQGSSFMRITPVAVSFSLWHRWITEMGQQQLRLACATAAANSWARSRTLAVMRRVASNHSALNRLSSSVGSPTRSALGRCIKGWRYQARRLVALRSAEKSIAIRRMSSSVQTWSRAWWLERVPITLGKQRMYRNGFHAWSDLHATFLEVDVALAAAAKAWYMAACKLRAFTVLRRHQRLVRMQRELAVHQKALTRLAALATCVEVWRAHLKTIGRSRSFLHRQQLSRGFARFSRALFLRRASQRLAVVARTWVLTYVLKQWRRYCSLPHRYHRLLAPLRHSSSHASRDRWNASTHCSQFLYKYRTKDQQAKLNLMS